MPPREEYLRSPTRSNHRHHHRGHHRNVALSPSSLSPQQQEDRRRLRRRSSSSMLLSRGKSVVSFSDNSEEVDVEVQEVRHWKDYTPDEKASVWYNQSEYQQFKDDCKDSIDAYSIMINNSSNTNKEEEEDNNTAVRENDDHDDHDHDRLFCDVVCTRGIERMTKECSCDYHHRRIEILKKVRWFKYSGRLDTSIRPDAREQQEHLLADIVNQLTTTSVLEAQDRAKKDEEFAFQYLKKKDSSSGILERRRRSTGGKNVTVPRRCITSLKKNNNTLNVSIPPPQEDEEGTTTTNYYYCALPVLSPNAKKKRSDNSPNYNNVKSKRKMRAHAGRLFREESLQRLSIEGL